MPNLSTRVTQTIQDSALLNLGDLISRDFLVDFSTLFSSSPASGTANAVADDYRDNLNDTTAPFGALTPGGFVTGSIETSGDRDIFAVQLTAGQTYTFNLNRGATSGLADPVLTLYRASGQTIASNDDFGGSRNSQITYTATTTGTHYLGATGYQSGTGAYRLSSTGTTTTTPPPAATDDFRDSLTDTTAPFGALTVGTAATGRIETGGDTDIFAVTLTAGQSYSFTLNSGASGGLSDPSLRLLNGSGTQLAANNDANGSLNSQVAYTATTSGTYYIEAKGATATLTGNYALNAANTTPATPPPATAGAFDIVIRYTGDAQYQSVFDQAAARWEEIITGDLPNFTSSRYGAIDDLLIDASIVAIDGRGAVLGSAGPDEFRSNANGGLPTHGTMRFDTADVAALAANGTLYGVILHEMGHVLGMGTLWAQRGLTAGQFEYDGPAALAEYRILSNNPNATFVPLENGGGAGTAGGHWEEDIFGTEIMTGYANGSLPISRMTIASLQDLGYQVNLAEADPYVLPGNLQSGAQSLVVAEPTFGII